MMKLDISKVEFSKNDIKIGIKVPQELTEELAYFIGIHVGDGTLSFDPKKYHYIIGYTGHLIDEYNFHKDTIISLIHKLFNKDVKISEDRRENKTSVRTYFKSKAIFTFLNRAIRLPIGSKMNFGIPTIIKNSNNKIKRDFLRGLADTDFSLSFKMKHRNVHYYPVIKLVSVSRLLMKEVKDLLIEQGLKPYFLENRSNYCRKRATYYEGSDIDLNGVKNMNLWMNKIGFNSEKHLTKYQIWKKFGFCPPHTNIIQRRAILNGKLDIYSFYSR